MWNKKQFQSENWQEFSRINRGVEEVLKAPITIDNGRYEIVDILSNSGGFGVIYKAKDNILFGRDVLIKARKYQEENLFSYEFNDKREEIIANIRKQTLLEARTLSKFKNNKESRMPNINNIVTDFCPELRGPHVDIEGYTFIYDNEEVCNNEPYIVMQVIDGENLLDYMENKRSSFSTPMWEIKVLEIAKEISTILRNIHKRQDHPSGKQFYYIYRDLKPDNIMITEGRYLTLLDFGGVALVAQRENGEFATNEAGIVNVYTEGYCSPEASSGSGMQKELDQRVDIYSLGMTMFQLLVGDHIKALIDEKTHAPLLEKLEGTCSPYTRELIEKCVQQNRDERLENMSDIIDHIMIPETGFTAVKAYWKMESQV